MSLLFAIVAFLTLVSSAPITPRDVYVPPVLYPHHGTVWKAGSTHNVTWDTSSPPAQITNKIGRIVLAKGDYLVGLSSPLAKGFDILNGRQEVTIPANTPAGDDYSIVFSLVHSLPLDSRDVVSPPITSPDEHSVWPVGTKQTVTWETKDIPPDSQLTNPNGKVVLGHLGPTGGLNLQLDHPLAENFKLRVGHVEITVPIVPPRDDYIVVLFGDSGNASPAFAITRITGGDNSTTTTSSTPHSTTSSRSTSTAASSASISIPQSQSEAGSTTQLSDPTATLDLPLTTSAESSVLPTETEPASTQPTSSEPAPQTGTGTAVPASASSNAARRITRNRFLGPRTSAFIAAFLFTWAIVV
ncbi:hypothetical protein DXG03_007449 [Asterophora parasitica]|uniref:Uncharacterized protein n=1 Tax=Asterophora parasitica TaxID=117018 RepID=A0A9P7G6F6_9AGAR|nr:hypothetical protein DXG03_007449 [Asterophora parasitica]